MLFDKKHTRFTLKEEALLIDGIRKIELCGHLTPDDEETMAEFQKDFIDRDLDIRLTTWKRIEDMFDHHGIRLPVDSSMRKRYHGTKKYWYESRGTGNFFNLIDNRSKDTPEERKHKRQAKRYTAWEKAGTQYEDIGKMTKQDDKKTDAIDKKMELIKKLVGEVENDMREVGIPVKAEIINISDYLPGRDEK